MKILAIDTTSPFACAGIFEGGKALGELRLNGGNTHSETILPAMQFLLGSLKLTAADLDLFALSAGPGSFTGVRIGTATVKGLAFGLGKPCVGLSSTECLAENLRDLDEGAILCPLLDARRKSVFNALFTVKDGSLVRLCPDRLIELTALREELAGYGEQPLYLCGDAYEAASAAFAGLPGLMETPAALRFPAAAGVAAAGLRAYENALADGSADKLTDGALAPIYLAPSQAERERTEKSAKLNGD